MKNLKTISILLIIFPLALCGLTLSDEEAAKVIKEAVGFPVQESRAIIEGESKDYAANHQAVQKLIKDGYIYQNPKSVGGSVDAVLEMDYLPTEKGQSVFIEGISFNEFYKNYTYYGVITNKNLHEIKEVLIDEQNATAIVSFTTKREPIEPVYSLFCTIPRCLYYGDKLKEIETHEIKLKKYDKGWRVMR